MLDQFVLLLKALGEAEYLYLLLSPAFIYGVGVAALVFVSGFFMNEPKTQITGLVLVIICTLAIFPYLEMRQKAEKRISSVYKVESPATVDAFKQQTKMIADAKWVFCTLGGLAGALLLVGPRANLLGIWISIAIMINSLAVVIFSIGVHFHESRIYHPDLLAVKNVVAAQQKSAAGD